eukprot:7046285-Alexandrium_andersonii.AAC.1
MLRLLGRDHVHVSQGHVLVRLLYIALARSCRIGLQCRTRRGCSAGFSQDCVVIACAASSVLPGVGVGWEVGICILLLASFSHAPPLGVFLSGHFA